MGNGALAIGPKLPRPSSTLPDRRFAAAHHSVCCRGLSVSAGRGSVSSPLVTGFGRRPIATVRHTLGPAFESRQGTKARDWGSRVSVLYGELAGTGLAAGGRCSGRWSGACVVSARWSAKAASRTPDVGPFEVCCMGLIATEAEHRRCRTSTSSTAQPPYRVIQVQPAS